MREEIRTKFIQQQKKPTSALQHDHVESISSHFHALRRQYQQSDSGLHRLHLLLLFLVVVDAERGGEIGWMYVPSVMIALVAAFTLNSSAQNLMTLMNGHFSGTLTLFFFFYVECDVDIFFLGLSRIFERLRKKKRHDVDRSDTQERR